MDIQKYFSSVDLYSLEWSCGVLPKKDRRMRTAVWAAQFLRLFGFLRS